MAVPIGLPFCPLSKDCSHLPRMMCGGMMWGMGDAGLLVLVLVVRDRNPRQIHFRGRMTM
jgi:hypothetical protein